jgi:uncharacterized membrane protein
MMGFGMGLGTLGIAVFFIFIVFIIGLAIWLLGRLFPRLGATNLRLGMDAPGEAAFDILQRRFAAGEISREEYRTMRDELSG